MSKNKRIIYVAGNGKNDSGYANWLEPDKLTDDINEANIILGVGGADISSHYYNQPDSGNLSCSPNIDAKEYADFQKAIKLNKKIIGICKSAQWGAVLAGGAVFQHIEHPSIHNISTFDKKVILSNSSHHNLADLSKLKENIDYKLLAWAEGISNIHIDGYGDNVPCPKEPEVVYYPKINFLAFQNHNEWTLDNPEFTDMISWSKDIFEKFLNNNL